MNYIRQIWSRADRPERINKVAITWPFTQANRNGVDGEHGDTESKKMVEMCKKYYVLPIGAVVLMIGVWYIC
jgi:hypothetical protein